MGHKYTKDEILTKYLNGVFYGQNAIGVQAASLTYFDKDVSQLSLAESAFLAGLVKGPGHYDPFLGDADRQASSKIRSRYATTGQAFSNSPGTAFDTSWSVCAQLPSAAECDAATAIFCPHAQSTVRFYCLA